MTGVLWYLAGEERVTIGVIVYLGKALEESGLQGRGLSLVGGRVREGRLHY